MANKAGQTVLTGGGTRAKVGQKIIPKEKALKINRKGQVIPRRVREKLGIAPLNDVEFVEEKGGGETGSLEFARLRGCATARMSTGKIMPRTRSEE